MKSLERATPLGSSKKKKKKTGTRKRRSRKGFGRGPWETKELILYSFSAVEPPRITSVFFVRAFTAYRLDVQVLTHTHTLKPQLNTAVLMMPLLKKE